MNTLVVLFALASVACGTLVPVAQPPHLPALVLDARGRPLDTAEVINARALHLQAKALEGHYGYAAPSAIVAPVALAPAVVAAPVAVSHQSRLDVRTSPAVVNYAPVLSHGVPLLGHGHFLHKRSLGHYVHAAPAAVSHQARVDVISSPAVVSHAVHAPVIAHAPVVALAPAAVSHQSRVDIINKPAVVSHAVVAPVISHAAPVVAVAPAAVSHQSRLDVRTSPAILSHGAYAPYGLGYHGGIAPIAHDANLYASPYGNFW